MKTTTKEIEHLGWEIEREWDGRAEQNTYRASQSGFKTQWRLNLDQVRSDVQAIVEARKQPSIAPF